MHSNNETRFIRRLNTVLDTQLDYYEYQMARYFNDTSIDLRGNWEVQWRNIGFDVPAFDDLRKSAYVNVIKSVVDTLVNKLANQKVRPYFTPVNGTWKTKRVVKQVQQYFDLMYDVTNIHHKISNAFRSACVNGKGYLFVNPFTYEIKDLCAHEVATLQDEERYSIPSHCAVRFLHFPVADLKLYGVKKNYSTDTVNLFLYFDVLGHQAVVFVNGVEQNRITYKVDTIPLVPLYFNEPLFGNQTTSIVHELDGIQTQIDYINSQISAATQLSPANQTFVQEGSSLAAKDLSNKAGTVYTFKLAPGQTTPPIVSITPRMFDPQWLDLQKYYIQQAYEIIGISQLSAMSKKPSGLDSGVALTTMEDIESDRFEVHVSHYVKAYVDLAKLIIEILPDNADILPASMNTNPLKWKDIKEQSDLFKVQYSAATALSKDPSEKLKQVMQMSQVGLITPDKISSYLDMPDLEDAYSKASAIADGVNQCIARAIEEGDVNIPDWVSYQALSDAITTIENELYSSITDGNDEQDMEIMNALQALRSLEENLAQKMEENGYVTLNRPDEQIGTDQGLGVAPEAINTPSLVQEQIQENENLANAEDAGLGNETGVNANAESLENQQVEQPVQVSNLQA